MDKIIQVIQALAPIFATVFAVGGAVVAYIKYLERKPENLAKARQLNITGELLLTDGYNKLLATMDERFNIMETAHKKEVDEYRATIRDQANTIKVLTNRVDKLEDILRVNNINYDI